MQHIKSESDIISLAPSSPPRPVLYYVQSPSRESHDGEKFSVHATPTFGSPMESPSHPSVGRHSRNSSSTRFSGIFRSLSGRKFAAGGSKVNEKGWPECNVIVEEGNFDADDRKLTRRCQALIALAVFFLLFTVFCLIIWAAARPFRTDVAVRSLSVNNLYLGSGTDFTGVPTKMLNVNGSLRISVYNPATFYGIHVSSSPVDLKYSDIVVATGQLEEYFQPRRSRRTVAINVEGTRVPLYGAGSSLEEVANSDDGAIRVPLTLEFEVTTTGDVVGKLVRTRRRRKVSCRLLIDSRSNKAARFRKKGSCTYT